MARRMADFLGVKGFRGFLGVRGEGLSSSGLGGEKPSRPYSFGKGYPTGFFPSGFIDTDFGVFGRKSGVSILL